MLCQEFQTQEKKRTKDLFGSFLCLSIVIVRSEKSACLSPYIRSLVSSNHVEFACDTYKYPSIDDFTREDHGLVYGEANVSGPE